MDYIHNKKINFEVFSIVLSLRTRNQNEKRNKINKGVKIVLARVRVETSSDK